MPEKEKIYQEDLVNYQKELFETVAIVLNCDDNDMAKLLGKKVSVLCEGIILRKALLKIISEQSKENQ